MKRVLAVVILTAFAAAGGEKAPEKKGDADPMKAFIEAARPVEEHKRLAELVGPWKMTTTFWLDGATLTGAGMASGRMTLGGRYLHLDGKISGGINAESLLILGFDRRTSDYTMIGLDTLGTYYITAAGKYDPAKKGVVLGGSYASPMGEPQAYYFLWTTPSPREHVITFYLPKEGEPTRVSETRFTRD